MVTRFIDALDASNAVIATHTETNDAIMSWDIPTIFPTLVGGTTYNFVMRTPETADYTAPILYVLDQIGAVVALRMEACRPSVIFPCSVMEDRIAARRASISRR